MRPPVSDIVMPPCPAGAPSRRAVLKATAGVIGVGGSAAFGPSRWPGPEPGPASAQPAAAGGTGLVLAADQASERVLLLNVTDPSWQHVTPGVPDLRSLRASSWSWSALDHTGLSGLEPKQTWSLVSEAKYRFWNGEHWVLTCASGGMAAMVAYPDGRVRWAAATDANAHSVEVLPDGNVAVAASDQGFVRIYTASQSARSTNYTHFDLPGAHGLQWDHTREVLWAVGGSRLVALGVTGRASRPRITLESSVVLPSQGGHDLNAVATSPDLLWLTTNSHVHQYSVPDLAFGPYAGEAVIDAPSVKSISDDPVSGQVLTVSPDNENPCQWCTSTLTFHLPDGTRRLARTSLYKARWMPALPVGRTRG
jgi:hypothetical protein